LLIAFVDVVYSKTRCAGICLDACHASHEHLHVACMRARMSVRI
jgi:hypothetical protein